MAETLGLSRDQYKPIVGDDFLAQRQFEQLFDRSNEIPALQDGVDDNTIGLDTLSDLVRPITIDPIEPLTAQVSGDTTFTIPATATIKTVWIPVAYLVASSGGPWTLTITTGSGTNVLVPISASGDTISSGDLLFDIQVDDSGNTIAKSWEISGSNANGIYEKTGAGGMRQSGVTGSIATGGNATVTLPCAFANTSYQIVNSLVVASGANSFGVSNSGPTASTGFTLYSNGAVSAPQSWFVIGTWRV